MAALAKAHHDAIRGAVTRLWAALPARNREIGTSLTISTLVHVALLIIVGTSMYEAGDDELDLPELSVQLETREGPTSETVSEAAALAPQAEVVEAVAEIPDSASAPLMAESPTPDVVQIDTAVDAASAESSAPGAASEEADGALLTTSGDSSSSVAISAESVAVAVPVQAVEIPKDEQNMLSQSILQLAQQMLDEELTETQLTWEIAGQEYTAKVTRQPAADSTGLEKVLAEIVTQAEGKRRHTTLSMKRLAFSHFTQLVDRWDTDVRIHDDIIGGRFHSNTGIAVAFDNGVAPQFLGRVTTAAHTVTIGSFNMRRRGESVFRGGIETRTERVAMPRTLPAIAERAVADGADRRTFDASTRIVFNADGSYAWRELRSDGAMQIEPRASGTRYLLGTKGAKLFVRGTILGGVVVQTPNDIVIEGSLVYATDPRDSPLARDYLTLIAGGDIEIANRSVTGPGDLHIHATLYARQRFAVREAYQGKPAKLYVLGSLTAGTLSETEPRYATQIDFDSRFENRRPPEYPMTRRYEVESWSGAWQESDGESE